MSTEKLIEAFARGLAQGLIGAGLPDGPAKKVRAPRARPQAAPVGHQPAQPSLFGQDPMAAGEAAAAGKSVQEMDAFLAGVRESMRTGGGIPAGYYNPDASSEDAPESLGFLKPPGAP